MKPMFVINLKQPACDARCGAAMRGLDQGSWLEIASLDSQRDHQHSYEKTLFEICPEVEIV